MIHRPRNAKDDRGFVLVWFAVVIVVLLVVSALVVDILHAYSVVQRTQNAADAGALAGAQQLPDNRPGAQATARSVVLDNMSVPAANITFDPVARQNQLKVTVRDDVDTFFGRVIGIDSLPVRRSSTAEFDPPVAMGSPESSFGNIPGGTTRGFWATVAGPDSDKSGGNAAMSSFCEMTAATGAVYPTGSANPLPDNCISGDNNPDHEGSQFFVIDKRDGADLFVDLFDPVWVATVDGTGACNHEAAAHLFTLDPDPKHDPANAAVCTGDQLFRFRGSDAYHPSHLGPPPQPWLGYTGASAGDRFAEARIQQDGRALVTRFELYGPDNTPANPYDNVTGSALCDKEYQGYTNAHLAYAADPVDRMLQYYHAWDTTYCSTSGANARPGKYTLRVTTAPGNGVGANHFSLAASTGVHNALVNDPDVSLYAVERMGISSNEPTATGTFYLARVLPSSVRRTLRVTLFDVSDLFCPGGCPPYTMSIEIFAKNARAGATGPVLAKFPLRGCRFTPPPGLSGRGTPLAKPWTPNPPPWGAFSNLGGDCLITGVTRAVYNGQYVTVDIPIPDETGYTCDVTDPASCWLQISFTGNPSTVRITDVSTWVATMNGLPSRIIE